MKIPRIILGAIPEKMLIFKKPGILEIDNIVKNKQYKHCKIKLKKDKKSARAYNRLGRGKLSKRINDTFIG